MLVMVTWAQKSCLITCTVSAKAGDWVAIHGCFHCQAWRHIANNRWSDERVKDRELFYLCDCVITQVGIEVNTEDEIHHEHNCFVTTDQIQLLFDYPTNYLLQEQAPIRIILQESEFGVLLRGVSKLIS